MAAISGSEATLPASASASAPARATRVRAALAGAAAREAALVACAGLMLLWPALANGFPLIFSDTGTYVSQVLEGHLGWDRPPFYSLYLALLGWGVSLWPPVAAQALASAWLVRQVQRSVAPASGTARYLGTMALLAAATGLPWTVSTAIPDIFAPLAVLALFLLVFADAGGDWRRWALVLFLAVAVAMHLSILPISAALLLAAVLPLRIAGRLRMRPGAAVLAVLLGTAALTSVNLLARGRPSPSPYAATFVLARELADGPALATLARDCTRETWALCRYRHALPGSADAFLWDPHSPLYRAGGPRRLIGETDSILWRTLVEHPRAVLADAGGDFVRQVAMIRPATGLGAWSATAGATIRRDLPRGTVAAFDRSRQARGRLALAPVWARLDEAVEAAASVVCVVLLGAGLLGGGLVRPAANAAGRRRCVLALLGLLALLANAAVTGALSGPHDRYQSRIAWLPVLVVALGAAPRRRSRRPGGRSVVRPVGAGEDDQIGVLQRRQERQAQAEPPVDPVTVPVAHGEMQLDRRQLLLGEARGERGRQPGEEAGDGGRDSLACGVLGPAHRGAITLVRAVSAVGASVSRSAGRARGRRADRSA